jgi:hypothetical protein
MIAQKFFGHANIAVRQIPRIDNHRLFVPPRIAEIFAIERASDGNLALRAATNRTDFSANARAMPLRTAYCANRANHFLSIGGRARPAPVGSDGTVRVTLERSMSRTHLFLKIEVEHEPEETPQRIGEELCRQLLKSYGVRQAEVASFSTVEE